MLADIHWETLQGHSAPVAHMCVEASGGLLATASADKCVRVWNLQGHFCTHVFRGHRCHSLPMVPRHAHNTLL